MNNSDFYGTIFKRKSIRRYGSELLEASRLQRVQDYIDGLTPLYDNIKTEIVILPENQIKTILSIPRLMSDKRPL